VPPADVVWVKERVVVGNEADVELFSMQDASKAIETEGKIGPQFLAQIECPEVRAGAMAPGVSYSHYRS
jgi:hypothetical protein